MTISKSDREDHILQLKKKLKEKKDSLKLLESKAKSIRVTPNEKTLLLKQIALAKRDIDTSTKMLVNLLWVQKRLNLMSTKKSSIQSARAKTKKNRKYDS